MSNSKQSPNANNETKKNQLKRGFKFIYSLLGRGLLIPHGYLHLGKCEHSEVQSSSMIAGASLWFMGGHLTDLKIWQNVRSGRGKDLEKYFSTFV